MKSLALLVVALPLAAQSPERHTFTSTVLHETRTVDVSLPSGYTRDTTARYPVIVVLDGESQGQLATSITRFYASVGTLPATIIVAVNTNGHRTRDMTPAAVAGFTPPPDPNGHAEEFARFIGDEVLPWVTGTYRTAPMRVLVGHSLGGLFAMETLVHHPTLFTGYVMMEPATWWNDEKPLRDAREAINTPALRRARVMLVNSPSITTDTTSWGGDKPMVRMITVKGETHESMPILGMTLALRRMFEDFRPPQWTPGTAPIAMLGRLDSLSMRLGYRVAVPAETFETAARMSLDARLYGDADSIISRMVREQGASPYSRELAQRLAAERNSPTPKGWIPLVIPAHRPTPREASRFIGRWKSESGTPHEVDVRASGDTIIVHDHITSPDGAPFDADDPVIQVTTAGTLEWGLPFFRGLAALVVMKATMIDDDTIEVRREARGWIPQDPHFDSGTVVRFRRVH